MLVQNFSTSSDTIFRVRRLHGYRFKLVSNFRYVVFDNISSFFDFVTNRFRRLWVRQRNVTRKYACDCSMTRMLCFIHSRVPCTFLCRGSAPASSSVLTTSRCSFPAALINEEKPRFHASFTLAPVCINSRTICTFPQQDAISSGVYPKESSDPSGSTPFCSNSFL